MVDCDAPARSFYPRAARCTHLPITARIGARPTTTTIAPRGHSDRLFVVEALSELLVAEFRSPQISSASWVLNGVGELSFTVSSWDPAIDSLTDGNGVVDLIGREIQWWRDGVIRWSGVPTAATVGLDGTVTVDCFDLGWYMTRRMVGAAERHDRLGGVGSMDRSGLPGWTRTGSAVAVRDHLDRVRGYGSCSMSGSGTIQTSFTEPTTGVATVLPIHVTAMVKPATGTPVGSALLSITVRGTPGGAIVSEQTIPFDESMSAGAWQRISDYALLPPGAPHYVTVTCWSPHGTIHFDDVRALKNDTTGIPEPGADLCVHGRNLWTHFQSDSPTARKASWNIPSVIDVLTGVVEPLGERHVLHTQAPDVLARYTERSDGFDWWINEAERRVHFSKRRGVDHKNLAFHRRAVKSGGWVHDESERSTDVVVLGDGDGVDRPEGSYIDRTGTQGISLDWVVTPPAQTPLAAIDPMAFQVWGQKARPQVTPDPFVVDLDEFLGELVPGDSVPCTQVSGRLRMVARFRVAKLTADLGAGTLVVE